MLAALVAVFQKKLTAKDEREQISLDYLLRCSIRGSACGTPASIANLVILDRPSNDASTARQLMDEACKITTLQSKKCRDPAGALRYCVMTADNPLFAQMQRIMRDCPDGKRNEVYKCILPQAGHMHQAMAFQDALKFCTWDSCLEALAAGSGLSPGMIDNFRSRKEYKTCLRFCRQALVALWIRLLDVCFEEGVLLCNDAMMQKIRDIPPVRWQ